jgi:hypothetical protein
VRLNDVLILLLGASLSLHVATVAAVLTFLAGKGVPEAALTGGGSAAGAFGLWIVIASTYLPRS